MTRTLIAGNWKMHGLQAARAEARTIAAEVAAAGRRDFDVALFPPATLLVDMVRDLADTGVIVGGQDCHTETAGAFTGSISAAMLADAGAHAVLLGHSERRMVGDTDACVRGKIAAAAAAGLAVVACVGESNGERAVGQAVPVVRAQVRALFAGGGAPAADFTIAYEPLWAIGTGRTPTGAEIVDMHAAIRKELTERLGPSADRTRILYGGSVKPGNAAAILALPNVDGALVGAASLTARDFLAIIAAAPVQVA